MSRAATAAARKPASGAPKRPAKGGVAKNGRQAAAIRPTPAAGAATKRVLRVVPRDGARQAALGSGLLDRLLRGRAWIAFIGVLLVGVVFLNVSLLEINRGITEKAERIAALKRANGQQRVEVAELASSERIQQAATDLGFLLPAPGDVTYLKATPSRDARRAAQTIVPPTQQQEQAAAPAVTEQAPAATEPTQPPPTQQAPPVSQAPPTAGQEAPAQQAPGQEAPAQAAPPAGQTAPGAQAPPGAG